MSPDSPGALLFCLLRSACARAEPVVSACVLEKSLERHISRMTGQYRAAPERIWL